MKYQNVMIIGLGMIGVSFARALKKQRLTKTIVGVDCSAKHRRQAKQKAFVDRVNAAATASDIALCDLIVVATPVRTIPGILKEIAPHVKKSCLVMDVGSTKKAIIKASEKHFANGQFVGAHPMAGSEKSGPMASVEGLFVDAPCLLVQPKNGKALFVKKAKALWEKLGARVAILNPEEHDHYLAFCSHLPHVAAFALMAAVARRSDPKALEKIGGPSFKSYTRHLTN